MYKLNLIIWTVFYNSFDKFKWFYSPVFVLQHTKYPFKSNIITQV